MLYVEGPRDRDILRSWARRLTPALVRDLEGCTVILGGRQPARALKHFEGELVERPELRGICVLDRDGDSNADSAPAGAPELEFFTWPRRHIESYLLVPAAIRRAAPGIDPKQLARALDEHVPSAAQPERFEQLHAKRLLEPSGPIFRGVDSPPPPSAVARAMRADEIHGDVRALLERVQRGVSIPQATGPVVVRRTH